MGQPFKNHPLSNSVSVAHRMGKEKKMYQDDGKNIMFTNTIHTDKERREQERLWEEVIRQMRSDLW